MNCGNPNRPCRDGWQRALGVLLAAVALAPLPAAAQQARGYAFMQSEILDSMTVRSPADMDFGRILPGTANGSVVMTPTASTTATCNTNSGIVRTGVCRAAQFDGQVPFIFGLQITKPAG